MRNIDITEFTYICGALRDLVPFVQFKKLEKPPWRSVNFSKVAGFSKWYQIVQRITYLDFSNVNLKFLTFRSLKSKLQSCQNEKKCQQESMEKICLVLVSKRIHPKKYQVSERFFYNKQVYINGFLVIIRNWLVEFRTSKS